MCVRVCVDGFVFAFNEVQSVWLQQRICAVRSAVANRFLCHALMLFNWSCGELQSLTLHVLCVVAGVVKGPLMLELGVPADVSVAVSMLTR